MTRKKVRLAYINNDSTRKATYKKRKKGFLKKIYELTTLCEIKACAIIYSPYDAQPEVWPNMVDAQHVLAKFKRLPEMEKSKKMMNQEEFLKQRINKAADQLQKLQRENRMKEMSHIMYECLTGKGIDNLSILDLNDLGWLIDQNLKEIYKRLEELTKEDGSSKGVVAVPAGVVGQTQSGAFHGEDFGVPRGGFDDMGMEQAMQGQPWFMDMMNPQDHAGGFGGNNAGGGKGGGGSNMPMTFADYSQSSNPLWSSAFFP